MQYQNISQQNRFYWRYDNFNEALLLSQKKLSDFNLQQMTKFQWPNIKVLDLSNKLIQTVSKNKITDTGIKNLLQRNWSTIEELYLTDNWISDVGIEYLVKYDWPQLRILSLTHNKLTDRALQTLVSASWKKLKSLWLSFNSIGPNGVEYLSEHQ